MNVHGAKTKMGGIVPRLPATPWYSCDERGDGASRPRNWLAAGFCDPRLGRRFQKLVGQLVTRLGQTIPLACQDWTNTKGGLSVPFQWSRE
jgi:hypothetical protein